MHSILFESPGLHKWVKEINRYLPQECYEEKDQLNRASTSIINNFAEGYGRYHSNDKRNFYVISRGSIFECVAVLDTILSGGYISESNYQSGIELLVELSKMISGLIKSKS